MIAVSGLLAEYRVTRAKRLWPYVQQLLDKARTVAQTGKTKWVRLRRKGEAVTTAVN